jgi:SAM-dependent methyltransferase
MTHYAYHLPRIELQSGLTPRRIDAAYAIGERDAERDDRWPAIAAELAALREAGRFSVRIVDADCGTGALLLAALRHARAIGFTAIEGRGIDGAPALVARARSAARRLHDPAIGVVFEVAALGAALIEEADVPADIVLWHGRSQRSVPAAVAAAGHRVIADPVKPTTADRA